MGKTLTDEKKVMKEFFGKRPTSDAVVAFCGDLEAEALQKGWRTSVVDGKKRRPALRSEVARYVGAPFEGYGERPQGADKGEYAIQVLDKAQRDGFVVALDENKYEYMLTQKGQDHYQRLKPELDAFVRENLAAGNVPQNKRGAKVSLAKVEDMLVNELKLSEPRVRELLDKLTPKKNKGRGDA